MSTDHRRASWGALQGVGSARSHRSRTATFWLIGTAGAAGWVAAAIARARQRAAADAARREEDRLRHLIASKDEFVASVSHELRTPLTAVVGLAAELKREAAKLPAHEIEEFSAIVHHQAVEVANIVDDLLVAARADVGQVIVEITTVDLREELETVIAGQPTPPSATLHHPEIRGGTTLAQADDARVRQIIRNLIGNAVRYGGDRVEARLLTEGGRAVLEIADDGPGIPADGLDDLFALYRTHREPGRTPTGRPGYQAGSTGLGLSVSQTLARLMAGDLIYERRDGWSVFRLELPAAL